MALNPPPEQKPKLMSDEFDTKSQKKQKHPEGLKGKEIGMHYAKKLSKGAIQKSNNKKTSMSEWVSQGMPQGSTNSSESKQSKHSQRLMQKSYSEILSQFNFFASISIFSCRTKSTAALVLLESKIYLEGILI